MGTLAGLLGDPARVRTLQYRFRRADGEWIWIESTFTNQVGVAGVDAIVINFRNIHDRRMAEEALRDREMLLREMGRVARVGGWEFDVRTGAGRWTEEVARIHEVDPDAATTRELGISFYRGESRARIEAALERAVREGEPYDLELELTTARGAVRWVRTLGQPVWEEGRVVKLRGAIQDVTASKRAELALAAEATRRRILIEGSRDGIVVLDREGGVFEANRRFAEMLGYTAEEVLQLHVWDWDRDWPRERVLAAIRDLGPEGARFESRHWRKDGSFLDVELSNSVAELGGQRLVFSVCHDVTERKRAVEALREREEIYSNIVGQAMDAIALVDGATGRFVEFNTAAHEQLGYTREEFAGLSIRDIQADHSPREIAANLDLIRTQGTLAFESRHRRRDGALRDAHVRIRHLRVRKIGEQVRLSFDGFTGALPAVSADAGMLEQVLVNLVVNARDAMPRGGTVTLATGVLSVDEAEARLNANRKPGRFVRLEVSDNGEGMDRETQERLFEPFFTTKEPGKGTGLGLATVHGIVAQHQGWIEVESEVGRGATVRVFLPALAGAPIPEPAPPPPEPVRRGSEGILLVEDESQLRRMIALNLRSLGYRVWEAGNGQEALQVWREHAAGIDLLFTDMVMPEGMTGLELATLLRAGKPSLKVVLSSGYSSEIVEAGGVQEADIRYLAKPYQARVLATTIRACLDEPPRPVSG